MLAWRIVAAVLGVVLITVVAIDIIVVGDEAERVLWYQKGAYLGQPDTDISDEVREQIRRRGLTAGRAR
jgi:hypothetical protein